MRGKLAKWGNSTGIRLPNAVLNAAGLSRGDEVEIAVHDGVVAVPVRVCRSVSVPMLMTYQRTRSPLRSRIMGWLP